MAEERGALDRSVGAADHVRRVFDELPAVVVAVAGADLRVVAATGAYRAYVGRQEVVGAPLREVFAGVVAPEVFEVIEDCYRSGEPARPRGSRLVPDAGRESHVDFDVVPRRDGAGRVTGLVITVEDRTERVRERRAAQQRVDLAEERHAHAQDSVDVLQRELLPDGVPVLPGVRMAAGYLLADARTAAGGDWFAAVPLPGGRVGLVVGDVVGHGVRASAAMGQLRVVLEEHLRATGDPLAAVLAADAATERVRGTRAATVCVAVLDPGTGALAYASAGHPPPLLVPAGGGARYLPGTVGGPLGTVADRSARAVGAARLERGDLLLLYTDGVVERPGLDLARGTAELARVAADTAARDDLEVERVCERVVDRLVRPTGHADDITLLAAQLVPAPEPLALTLPAAAGSLSEVRVRLDAWLDGLHLDQDDVEALRHAAVELATNVVDHAYIDSVDEHAYTLTAELTDAGTALLGVSDQGRWREPRPSADRGLGLRVTAELVDALRVEHDGTGTTVVVEHRLVRAARLTTAAEMSFARPAPRRHQADPLLVLDQPGSPGPRLRVDGPVDGATARTVEHELLVAGSTGTRSLTVDLTGVTHLASAGVSVLHRLSAAHRDNGTELLLYAPPDSAAGLVMDLVDLPHRTRDPDER